MNTIGNEFGILEITLLNKKIEEYNKIPDDKKEARMQLLQEINHAHMHLQTLFADFTDYENPYASIKDFEGVSIELQNLGELPGYGAIADDIISKSLSTDNVGLPTFAEYVVNTETSKNTKFAAWRINYLNQLKMSHSKSDYVYALKDFKKVLLDKLCFGGINKKDVLNFRSLLRQVSHEIIVTQENDEKVKDRASLTEKILSSNLYQYLLSLASNQKSNKYLGNRTPNEDKMQKFMSMLRSSNEEQKFSAVQNIELPTELKFEQIGNGNNQTWMVSSKAESLNLVLSIGLINSNQSLLEKSTVNAHLTPTYFSKFDSDYRLVLTDYCSKGDLKQQFLKMSDADRLIKAPATMKQLTSIMEGCLKENVAHTDIKLSNFLTDSTDDIVITDVKGFAKIDGNGNLPRNYSRTPEYEPPEGKCNGINAEAYMTYQLGLAFLETLNSFGQDKSKSESVSKKTTEETTEETIERLQQLIANLNVDQRAKILISSMINADPTARPKLSKVLTKLNEIFPNQASSKEIFPNQASSTDSNPNVKKNDYKYYQKFSDDPRVIFKKRYLKSRILDYFKTELEACQDIKAVADWEQKIQESEYYKCLGVKRNWYNPKSDNESIIELKTMIANKKIELNEQSKSDSKAPFKP